MKSKITRAEMAAAKNLDSEIELIFKQNCQNIQISILDIPKVFEAGRLARAEGRDMKEAIVSFVNSIKKK